MFLCVCASVLLDLIFFINHSSPKVIIFDVVLKKSFGISWARLYICGLLFCVFVCLTLHAVENIFQVAEWRGLDTDSDSSIFMTRIFLFEKNSSFEPFLFCVPDIVFGRFNIFLPLFLSFSLLSLLYSIAETFFYRNFLNYTIISYSNKVSVIKAYTPLTK